jgi:hypothetical protein
LLLPANHPPALNRHAIISLDKLMPNNGSIVKFQQVGTGHGTGSMKFCDKNEQETHAVTVEERNKIQHASNSILMPPTSVGPREEEPQHVQFIKD